MKISWVFSNNVNFDPLFDIDSIKSIGSSWGGWQTWKVCQTDNVICHDFERAKNLIENNFHHRCNFYIPESISKDIKDTQNVNIYGGDFVHEVINKEEIVSIHLSAITSKVILLYGFNFSDNLGLEAFDKHRIDNYRGLVREAIKLNSDVQWVLIDHAPLSDFFQDIKNLTQDTLPNVIKLLSVDK